MTSMKTDSKNFDQLLQYTSKHWDEADGTLAQSDEFWELIDAAKSDRDQLLEFIRENASTGSPQNRTLAAQIAGQLCNPIEPEIEAMAAEISDILLRAISKEKQMPILAVCTDNLRFMPKSTKIIDTLLELTYHQDEDVRFYAARALACLADEEFASDTVIKRLIELSSDGDANVRDWTTYGLSSLIEFWGIDRQDIRDALFARVKDRHADTRAEAFWGLAVAKDERGILPLKQYLEKSKSIGKLDIQAAGEYGRHEFYEPLKAIQKWWDIDAKVMDGAVNACEPK